jgi:hypothetical protein
MEFTNNDMKEIFDRARAAFYEEYLAQTEHALEERLCPAEMSKIVKIHADDYLVRLVDDMAWIRNVPAGPISVFTSYETAERAMAGVFAAASRVEQDLWEEGAPDEFIDRCHAVTFDLADYLLKKQP